MRDRVDPAVVFADKVDQTIDSFGLWDIEFHRLFADIKIHLPGGTSHIAEIGISHLAGSIHDATHDRDFYPF